MKKYIFLLTLVMVGSVSYSASYRAIASGDWSDASIWDVSPFDGSGGDGVPGSSDIAQTNGFLIGIDQDVTVDRLVVHATTAGSIFWNDIINFAPVTITVITQLLSTSTSGPTVAVIDNTDINFVLTGTGTILNRWSTSAPLENLTINSSGNFTLSEFAIGAGTFSVIGGTQANFIGDITNNGTFSVSIPAVFNKGSLQIIGGTSSVSFTNTVTFNNAMDFNTSATFGSTITAGANALSFANDFTNNGSFNSTGTTTFDGNTAQSIAGSSSTNFQNLTISNTTSTVTIGGGGSSVDGTLTVANGGILATGGLLTLISNASGTASVSDLTGASITGNVVYQRYFDGGGDVWRNFGIGVSTGLVTDITSAGYTVNGPDLGYYSESTDAWVTQSTFGASLGNNRGYSLYTRVEDGNHTISFTGTLNQGTQNPIVTRLGSGGDAGWNLVNNPYASTIDFDLLTRSNIDNNVAVWNTSTSSYDYWNGSTGNLTNGLISSGQAFWVHSTSGTPSLTINETDKSTSTTSFLRTNKETLSNHLIVKLAQGEKMDITFIHFKEGAVNDFDSENDALKLSNGIYNISTKATSGENLAINSMATLASCSTSIISVNIDNISVGSYNLSFEDVNSFAGLKISLIDNLLNSSTILSEGTVYSFEVTADATSWGADRFELVFDATDPIDTSVTGASETVCGSDIASVIISNSNSLHTYNLLSTGVLMESKTGADGELVFDIPTNKLSEGDNLFDIEITSNCMSHTIAEIATISYFKVVNIASVSGAEECGEASLSLLASGAPTNGEYRWYETIDATTPIAGEIGSQFTTPTLTSTKSYYVSVVNEGGCESERVLVEAVINDIPIAEIALLENHLLQSVGDYDSYQWYKNGVIIEGATSKSYQVVDEGIFEFTLVVSKNGCLSEQSVGKQEGITSLDLDDFETENILIYPNPIGNEALTIKFDTAIGDVHNLILSDNQGKVVKVIAITKGEEEKEIDFNGMSNGIYYIHLITESNKHVYKILKH